DAVGRADLRRRVHRRACAGQLVKDGIAAEIHGADDEGVLELGVAAEDESAGGSGDGAGDTGEVVAGQRDGLRVVAGLEDAHAGIRAGGGGGESDLAAAAEVDPAKGP